MAYSEKQLRLSLAREAELTAQLKQLRTSHAAEISFMRQEHTTQILALLAAVSRDPVSAVRGSQRPQPQVMQAAAQQTRELVSAGPVNSDSLRVRRPVVPLLARKGLQTTDSAEACT